MKQLFTIGHSIYPEKHFIELLKAFDIDWVLDVRSSPYSQYASQYNREVLNKLLEGNGIKYRHMGKWFGARQTDRKYYNEQGYLDFDKFRESDLFREGLESVKRGLKEYNIALMCTEKHPIDCHRAIMVARGFELDGIDVKHILHDGSFITQDDLNNQLLDRYFSFQDRHQVTMLEEDKKDDSERLAEAYRKRNSEIGYKIKDNEERDQQDDTLYDGIHTEVSE